MGFLNILTGGLLNLGKDIYEGISTRNAVARAAGLQLKGIGQAEERLTGAETTAEGTLRGGQEQAYDTAYGALQGIAGENQPYIQAGQQALMGLGAASQAQTQFRAPTAEDIKAQLDPSMAFTMDQGLQALQRSAAGRGRLNAGSTLKDINTFAQGLASTQYGQAYNRAYNNSLMNYESGQQNQANLFNRQYSLANMGYGAGSQVNQARQNFATNVMGLDVGTSERIAQSQLGLGGSLADLSLEGGNVRARATMGQNAAINTAVNNGLYDLRSMFSPGGFGGGRGGRLSRSQAERDYPEAGPF